MTKCRNCGKEFEAKRVTAMYCSDRCKWHYARKTDPPVSVAQIDEVSVARTAKTLSVAPKTVLSVAHSPNLVGISVAQSSENRIIDSKNDSAPPYGRNDMKTEISVANETITLSDGQQFTPSIKGYISQLDMQYGVIKGEIPLTAYRKAYPQQTGNACVENCR